MGCCASASWRWELQARAVSRRARTLRWWSTRARSAPTSSADPWGLRLVDGSGEIVLAEDPSTGAGSAGTLGFQSGGVWHHATRVLNSSTGDGYAAELATNDPGGRRISLRLRPTAEGVIGLDAEIVGAGPPVQAFGMGFGARRRRALPRVRRALPGGRSARQRGRELRLGRPVPARRVGPDPDHRPALGLSPAHGRHLLPGAVAALDRGLRRARRQPRDQLLPARQGGLMERRAGQRAAGRAAPPLARPRRGPSASASSPAPSPPTCSSASRT